MIGTYGGVILVLLAIAVGAALVITLVQLRRTLKSAETFLSETQPRLEHTLRQLAGAAERIDRLGAGVEEQAGRLGGLVDDARVLARSLRDIERPVRQFGGLGAALIPALAAAARAIFSGKRPAGPARPAAAGGATPSSETAGRRPAPRPRPATEVEHE